MKYLILTFLVFLASCQSNSTLKGSSSAVVAKAALASDVTTPDFKFSFFASGSGLNYKPFDSFTMDTTGMMTVHTSRKVAPGKFDELHALAQLDAPDFDTLKMLISKGKLYEIDSTDLTQVCPEDEMYHIAIVPLVGHQPIRLAFYTCAGDYNLLLQPQRKYFRLLLDWWERMRVKYRPTEPEWEKKSGESSDSTESAPK